METQLGQSFKHMFSLISGKKNDGEESKQKIEKGKLISNVALHEVNEYIERTLRTYCKMNEEKIGEFEHFISKLVEDSQGISFVPKKKIEELIEEIKCLKSKLDSTKEDLKRVSELEDENKLLKQGILSTENLLRNIESTYLEKLSAQELIFTSEKENLLKEIDALQLQMANFTKEIEENEKKSKELKHQNEIFDEKNKLLMSEILSNKRLIEGLSAQISDLEALKVGKFVNSEPKNLENLLRSKQGNTLVSFLGLEEFLELMKCNKQIYRILDCKAMTMKKLLFFKDFQFEKKSKIILNASLKFNQAIDKTPDEFLKKILVKYLCKQENFSDQLYSVISESNLFINQEDDLKLETQNKFNLASFFSKKASNTQENNKPTELMENYVNLFKIVFPHLILDKKEISENMKNLLDDKKFLDEHQETQISENCKKLLSKGSNSSNFANLARDMQLTAKFIEKLQTLFCKLIVHSGCALMERKELELLRNFMLKELYGRVERESYLHSDIEDLKTEVISERSAKELFSKKCLDLEKTLYESQSSSLELQREYRDLQRKFSELNEIHQTAIKTHSMCDSKLSALASQVKTLRNSFDSADNEKKKLHRDFLDFKLILEKLELEN